MDDQEANNGAMLGIAVGMPTVGLLGMGMYWLSVGDMPAFANHAWILAMCFGGMMGMYLGGLLGLMRTYENSKLDVVPPASTGHLAERPAERRKAG